MDPGLHRHSAQGMGPKVGLACFSGISVGYNPDSLFRGSFREWPRPNPNMSASNADERLPSRWADARSVESGTAWWKRC